jgi:hypothetical protein
MSSLCLFRAFCGSTSFFALLAQDFSVKKLAMPEHKFSPTTLKGAEFSYCTSESTFSFSRPLRSFLVDEMRLTDYLTSREPLLKM